VRPARDPILRVRYDTREHDSLSCGDPIPTGARRPTIMLRTPAGFDPSLSLSLEDDAIAHVFVGDALVQFNDSPGGLPWRFYKGEGLSAARYHAIGVHDGRAHVAVALDDAFHPRMLPSGLRAANLRNWFGVIDDATLSIAMRAVQLLEWDRTHRFCGACGTPTSHMQGERARKRCPSCGLTVYPRISPAMMVLVTRGRELLLGRGINFPPDATARWPASSKPARRSRTR
jgi:NAD+ diphosphatase